MTTATPHPLVRGYLRELHENVRTLPRAHRDELVQQIEEHLDEAIAPGSSEADVRNALDRLGRPEAIVAEEFDRLGIQPAAAGKLEWFTVFLLPFGFVVIPILGSVVAVMLLWTSRVWTTRQKVIGTLLPPGGLSAIAYLLFAGATTCSTSGGAGEATTEHCTGGLAADIVTPLFIAYVIAGIATPIFLALRASAHRT
jgi:uncharacterized membrane protein